jgi:hypothetical protein
MKNLQQTIKKDTNCRFVYVVTSIGAHRIEEVFTSKFKAKKYIADNAGLQLLIVRKELL